ncbi:cytochrome P450 [Fulvivirga imtechensis]|nr:cytochrome P450 [Fulvivirga imtechensis]
MTTIPKDKAIDSTPALLSDGYNFIGNRCDELGTDVFETRLMMKKVICMRGEEAARVFYDTDRFNRKKAAPKRLQKTLFGEGGVQGIDGESHKNRKELFMSLMSADSIRQLLGMIGQEWELAIKKWSTLKEVILLNETEEILCRAVCRWAGVPLKDSKVSKRTKQISSMITSAGEIALDHYKGRRNRKKAEKWISGLINKVRSGKIIPGEQSALAVFAQHRDRDGNRLDERVAAVEILNVLRPTVAIGRFIVFIAHALYIYPEYRDKLLQQPEMSEWFVQEVRRVYPFFPFAAARVKKDFEWNGIHFPKGRRVLLDLYGTNHHAGTWDDPEVFRPERFKHWNGSPYNFIPQGGGDHNTNHRCAGEWATIETMKLALDYIVKKMRYNVPQQDLTIDMSNFPAIPESRFVITNVNSVSST